MFKGRVHGQIFQIVENLRGKKNENTGTMRRGLDLVVQKNNDYNPRCKIEDEMRMGWSVILEWRRIQGKRVIDLGKSISSHINIR